MRQLHGDANVTTNGQSSPPLPLVLVVDDDATVRLVTCRMLEKHGFATVAAAEGIEAIALFEQQRELVTAVILDLTMPGMNGEETFQRLCAVDSGVRVLLSSGYSEADALARLAGFGLAGFIQKPYSADELLGALRSVIGG